MKLGWIHYSIGAHSGVEVVMRRFAAGLLAADPQMSVRFAGRAGTFAADWPALAPDRVSLADLPDLGLAVGAQTPPELRPALAEKLTVDMERELGGCDTILVENASVGAHPALNLALRKLMERPAMATTRFVFRVHDLAFSRPGNFAAIKALGAAVGMSPHELLFPQGPRATHLTVNRADAYTLYALGLDQRSIRYLPNPIDETLASGAALAGELRTAMETEGWVKPGEHLLVYPVRAVPRKNITEALLLTRLLNLLAGGQGGLPHALTPDGPFRLLVAVQPDEQRYSRYVEVISEFIDKHGLEARVGLHDMVGPVCRLKQGGGGGRCFGVAELYAASSAVVTTSVLEGFGFGFLEPWCAGRIVIGRRVPVMDDFEMAGMRMAHFYRRLSINDTDFPILGEPAPSIFAPVTNDFNETGLLRRLQTVIELDSGHNLGQFLTENRWAVERMLETMVRPRRLIDHNRERLFSAFSLKSLTVRLSAAISGAADPGPTG
jgi:hypothetical protein